MAADVWKVCERAVTYLYISIYVYTYTQEQLLARGFTPRTTEFAFVILGNVHMSWPFLIASTRPAPLSALLKHHHRASIRMCPQQNLMSVSRLLGHTIAGTTSTPAGGAAAVFSSWTT